MTDTDCQERLITAHLCLGNRDLQITSIYAPNNPGKPLFGEWSTRLLKFPHLPHKVGGDFNTVMHLTDDRSTAKQSQRPLEHSNPTYLATTMESLHFTDIWRLFHPVDREFTFYSPHNVFARIDYIFGTDNTTPTISESEIYDIAISNHAPISVSVQDPGLQPNLRLWSLPILPIQKC